MKLRIITFLLSVIALAASARAQTKEPLSYPMLLDADPLAVQLGQTAEVQVRSRYSLDGAFQVIASGSGVTAEVVPPLEPAEPKQDASKLAAGKSAKAARPAAKTPKPKTSSPYTKLALRFHVAADALPGLRDFRIATPHGASTLGQIVVVRDPVTVEKEPNDALTTATSISKLPATLCGAIGKAEDVDFFKFHAAKGQSLALQVRSARCENRIHDLQTHVDPILTLRNSSGTVLALSDNYFRADPLLVHRFAAEGDYYLEIRDVRYSGNPYWQYAVEVNDRPVVTAVFPPAVNREKPTLLELVGFNLPANPTTTITLPGSTPLGAQPIDLPLKLRADPALVWVSELPLTTAGENTSPAQAQPIEVPAGINGRIRRPGDVHYFRFKAAKGQKFSFEAMGRRIDSAIDPIIAVLNEKGGRMIENDDFSEGRMITADSRLENWTAPAAGNYLLEVRDLHMGGGPDYVYFVEARPSEPYFTLQLDTDKSAVGPGGAATIFARVFRHNGFTGEVKLAIDGLPPGMKATCGRILEGANDGCIVLQADATVKPAIANVRVSGESDFTLGGKTWKLKTLAVPNQEIYQPGGGRGQVPVDWHTVAIAAPLDILGVKLSRTQIKLKPGESQKIDVSIQRAAGFDKNVTLDVMYRHLAGIFGNSLPPGVTLDEKKSRTLLTAKMSEGAIVLTAAADAKPVENQVIPVIASVSINFVMKMDYSAPPVTVTVEKK